MHIGLKSILLSPLVAIGACNSTSDDSVRVLREESGIIFAYNSDGLFFGSPEQGADLEALISSSGYPRMPSDQQCVDYGFIAWPINNDKTVMRCGEYISRITPVDERFFVADISCRTDGVFCTESDIGITKYRVYLNKNGPFLVDIVYRDEVRASYVEEQFIRKD